MNNARERIAERVKNAYVAGYNDGTVDDSRTEGAGRMDDVAAAETARILGIVQEIEGDYWSAIADEAEREYRQMEEDDDGGE